ncbi:hypothetical protein L207DRAFT_572993 [Hyaloscypha variabilis F]|uniref:Uncharacterized protein n=1 Tax=Hyaloscypha variabilis (strain UAMH 11265 / GT02V1 / F) TaxID=1149755 RepID=A0A2J6QYN3_HYAVF|nr:hypothetical protein L207DRAFT_572993 [Hyaloscypha variabilis F]
MDTASSESTPLLSGKFQTGSHNDIEQHIATDARAKPHLRTPITILTVLVALLSLSTFGLLVATHILMDTGPFYGIWEPELVVRDQAIILFVTFILTTLTVFLRIPVVVNIPSQLVILVTIFVFSDKLLSDAFPDAKHSFCRLQHWDDDICFQARDFVKTTVAFSAGFGVLVGF